MADIKFISYDGAWPNLCSGTLTIEVNGVRRTDFELCSGGHVYWDDDETIEYGPWTVFMPDDLAEYEKIITDLVNENVPWGCCGGCI